MDKKPLCLVATSRPAPKPRESIDLKRECLQRPDTKEPHVPCPEKLFPSIVQAFQKQSSWQNLDALETIALTLPIGEYGLLSYYVVCSDNLFGIQHYVHSIDEEHHTARLLIRNDMQIDRKILVAWI